MTIDQNTLSQNPDTGTTVYFARWLLMPDYSIVEQGAVVVTNGFITDAGPRGSVRRTSRDRLVNLGQLLLMPGLINMHTHLEQGVARGRIDPAQSDSVTLSGDRIRAVLEASDEAIETAVNLNIRESLSSGITTIVDTWSRPAARTAHYKSPARIIPLQQLDPLHIGDEFPCIANTAWAPAENEAPYTSGIAPYALWSFSPANHRHINRQCLEQKRLWSIHIAETPDELMAFGEHSGPIFHAVNTMKPWSFEGGHDPLRTAATESLLPEGAILLHCTYADGDLLNTIAAKNISITICPQYAAMLSLRDFPLETALSRGVNICIGTEAPIAPFTTNLFDELYELKCTNPQIPASELLRCVTTNPARALHREGELGVLAPGACADIIGLKISHEEGADILEELLMEEPRTSFVMAKGIEIITPV